MAKIGYKRGVSNLISYLEVDRFKDGYMMLEGIDRLRFEKIDLSVTFRAWDRGRLFTQLDEVKWLKRADGFHIVMTTESDLPSELQLFRDDLVPRPDDRRAYLWGEKEFNPMQNRPLNRWYEARIPEVLNYPMDGAQSRFRRVCVKVREYEMTESDPDGRPFISIIHRYVGLEERLL